MTLAAICLADCRDTGVETNDGRGVAPSRLRVGRLDGLEELGVLPARHAEHGFSSARGAEGVNLGRFG